MPLPFLTLPDPVAAGEGALDPLGLSNLADSLAEEILPGLRARISRPRFLTAIAVAAVVCDNLEGQTTQDGTPPHVVFEWLTVEGLARRAKREDVQRTPGIQKAADATASHDPMRAKTYLKVPTVFGFHGVYKALATHMSVVDDDLRLGDNGYALLRAWEREQQLVGFIEGLTSTSAEGFLAKLRWAVEDSLGRGCTDRRPGWSCWQFFADHLAPSKVGADEAKRIYQFLADDGGGTRGEVLRLVAESNDAGASESEVVQSVLMPGASRDLQARLRTIESYVSCCTLIEDAFHWLRYLSASAGARAIGPGDFRTDPIRAIARELGPRLDATEDTLHWAPPDIGRKFVQLAEFFREATSADGLFSAVLHRHGEVQRAKPPEGKREWFEHGSNNAVFVRTPYRLQRPPEVRDWWNRPYRVDAVRSFWGDLKAHVHVPTSV